MLPVDYTDIVADGVAALRALAAELDTSETLGPVDPRVLLQLRDVSGLADRLAAASGWEWRQGFVHLSVVPQDLALLRAWAADAPPVRSPYRDAPSGEPVPGRQAALARLALFLDRYLDGAYGEPRGGHEPARDAPAS